MSFTNLGLLDFFEFPQVHQKKEHPGGVLFLLVDLKGFEPSTPTMRMWCAPSCATSPFQAFIIVPQKGNVKSKAKKQHPFPFGSAIVGSHLALVGTPLLGNVIKIDRHPE